MEAKNNGIKHGAYAEDLILPDENGDEFLQLYQALTEEWKPVGALEEDTVLTLTQCIWAKRRVEQFYYREATGGQFQGKDQIKYVIYLVELLEKTKTLEDATVITSRLPETYRLWIAQEVPRSNFQDDQSWIQALTPRIIDLAGAYANFASATLSTYKSNNSTYLRELTAKSRRKTLLRLLRPIVAKNVHAKTNFTGNSLRSDGSAGRRVFAMIQNYRGTALHANCRWPVSYARTPCNLSKFYARFNLSKFYEALLEQFVRSDVALLLFTSNLTIGEVTHVYAIASLA